MSDNNTLDSENEDTNENYTDDKDDTHTINSSNNEIDNTTYINKIDDVTQSENSTNELDKSSGKIVKKIIKKIKKV